MHSKAADSTHSLIKALLAPPQAPLVIEAPQSGAKKSQDCGLCKTALFSLHIGGSAVIVCILYHMSIVHSGTISKNDKYLSSFTMEHVSRLIFCVQQSKRLQSA